MNSQLRHKEDDDGDWTTVISSKKKKEDKRQRQRKSMNGCAIVTTPKFDVLDRVITLFDRFLNTPTDTIVTSYQIDGRCVNLYGLRESLHDIDRIDVMYYRYSNDQILFQSKKERKHLYNNRMYRPYMCINFHSYDHKTGEVSFYDDSDPHERATQFNSNLHYWLEMCEIVMYNAQLVYMELVGDYLRQESVVKIDTKFDGTRNGSSADSSSTALVTPSSVLPIWPRATPEDLLGRLQWYMDHFVAPDNQQVVLKLVGRGGIRCHTSREEYSVGKQVLPSHLINNADGVYTIVQECKPSFVFMYEKCVFIDNAVIEYRHNIKDLQSDGSYHYRRNQFVNGELNNKYDDEEQAMKYRQCKNIYQLLRNPIDIVRARLI
jgi:hypothetical protein